MIKHLISLIFTKKSEYSLIPQTKHGTKCAAFEMAAETEQSGTGNRVAGMFKKQIMCGIN